MLSARLFLYILLFSETLLWGHIDVERRQAYWNEECDKGSYNEVLKEQYHIWYSYSYSIQDRMKVFKWQENRLKQKLEIPIGWAHVAFYLSGYIDELAYGGINCIVSDLKERVENAKLVRQFNMRVVALKIYACMYFNMHFIESLKIQGWLLEVWKKKVRALFLPLKENLLQWEPIKKTAIEEMKHLFKKDKEVLKNNGKALAAESRVPFPELILSIEAVNKDFFYYWSSSHWSTPGIKIVGYVPQYKLLEEIYKDRKISFYNFLAAEVDDLVLEEENKE